MYLWDRQLPKYVLYTRVGPGCKRLQVGEIGAGSHKAKPSEVLDGTPFYVHRLPNFQSVFFIVI